MINLIPYWYNIQKEKFLRALNYTIFYNELHVCSTNNSADDILECAAYSCESNWGVNVIILYSAVLMGTSQYLISPFFSLSVKGLNPGVIS